MVLCAERSVDGGGVCRKKKEVLMSVVACVHKENGSDVDEGGGVCTKKKEVMLMRVVVCAQRKRK